MINFNYTKEEQIIPLPGCDEDDNTQEKSCFIDGNRISNIPVVSTNPLFSGEVEKSKDEEKNKRAKKQMNKK